MTDRNQRMQRARNVVRGKFASRGDHRVLVDARRIRQRLDSRRAKSRKTGGGSGSEVQAHSPTLPNS